MVSRLVLALSFRRCFACFYQQCVRAGTGIDELINEMVKLALESSLSSSRSASSKQQQHTQQSTTTQASETVAQYAQRNDELDLFRRYAPEARSFCFQLPFGFNFFCFPFKRRTRVSTS